MYAKLAVLAALGQRITVKYWRLEQWSRPSPRASGARLESSMPMPSRSVRPAGNRHSCGDTPLMPPTSRACDLLWILDVVADEPRILSLHSYRATDQVLEELSSRPAPGVVLHWWPGSAVATRRAVDLGCYFSVNAAIFQRPATLRHLPVDRLLPETDHPYGDRTGSEPHQPTTCSARTVPKYCWTFGTFTGYPMP
jgi:hypothetical protein